MKTKLLVLTIMSLVLVSCGEEFEQNPNLQGELDRTRAVQADETFSTDEVELMLKLCSSLEDKKIKYISEFVDASVPKISMQSHKGSCEGEASVYHDFYADPPTSANERVAVKNLTDKLYFGQGAVFPEVVVKDSKELSGFCQSVSESSTVRNHVVSANSVKWYSLSDSNDLNCSIDERDDKTICLKILTGYENSAGDGYVVKKVEYLKTTYALTDYRGVIFERQSFDSSTCETNDYVEKSQKIKFE